MNNKEKLAIVAQKILDKGVTYAKKHYNEVTPFAISQAIIEMLQKQVPMKLQHRQYTNLKQKLRNKPNTALDTLHEQRAKAIISSW